MNKTYTLMLIVYFCYCTNNVAQQKTDSIPVNMEKFDVKLFEKNKVGSDYTYRYDGKTIFLTGSATDYIKVISYDNNTFENQIVYYKKELTPKVVSEKLSDMLIGTIKYYDITGNLENERNMDAPFSFSIYDLRDWIKKQYDDVDIFEKKRGYLISRNPTPYPHYMLKFVTKDGKYIMYSINGVNGDIFYQNIDGDKKLIKPMPGEENISQSNDRNRK